MRIAMIGQRGLPATYGGVEHHVQELAVRLAERGHDVVVYCRRNYTNQPATSYRGVKLLYPPTYQSKHLEAAIHSGVASMLTIGQGFDIVHYHALGPGLWSPIPRWVTRAKVIQTIHGIDYDGAKWGRFARRVLRAGDWVSQRVPDAVVVVAAYLLDHYQGRRGLTVHIPNGVSPGKDRDDRVLERIGLRAGEYVLFVGRLIPEKGVDRLIRAFSQIRTGHQLVVVGGSSYTDDYELTIKALASDDPRVVLPGFVYGAELAALYSNAAIYAQPSLREGLPLTVLEAASYGLPLVLSDIPAHLEVLPISRAGGRLYHHADIAALASTLAEAIAAAPQERDAAQAAGRQIMDRYEWDAITDRTEELYARVRAS
jgi:glycosyltransferase involved in cell wall biosynthesis